MVMVTREEVEEDPVIRGLYSPVDREVPCVILQGILGGDRRVCNAVQDWCVGMRDDFVMVTAPLSEWRKIGALPKAERPGPEQFGRR